MMIELKSARLAKNITTRDFVFIITDQDGDVPILGSTMMSLLRFDPVDIIAQAVDLHGTDITVPYDEPVQSESKIARIIKNGVFHSQGGVVDNETDGEEWLDLGEDSPAENTKQ